MNGAVIIPLLLIAGAIIALSAWVAEGRTMRRERAQWVSDQAARDRASVSRNSGVRDALGRVVGGGW